MYFQKIYDCDRLSDYGQFLLGLCYQLLDNERQALSIFEVLQQKVSNHTAKLSIDSQIELYANMAICYKVIGNINASTNYNLIALSNLNDSEWQLAADLCCSIAMNYFVQKNYKEADVMLLLVLSISCVINIPVYTRSGRGKGLRILVLCYLNTDGAKRKFLATLFLLYVTTIIILMVNRIAKC